MFVDEVYGGAESWNAMWGPESMRIQLQLSTTRRRVREEPSRNIT